MRLHKIWRGWLNASFANQITLFALSFTLGVSLLIGGGSYIALRPRSRPPSSATWRLKPTWWRFA